MPYATTIWLALVVVVVVGGGESTAAHEQVHGRDCDSDECDSLVAKCNLTNKCTCDLKQDKYCARRCINCLEEKFGKCCACVGLCLESGEYKEPSHVGKLNTSDEYVAYFNVLTEEDDKLERWSVVRQNSVFLQHPEHGQLDVAYRIVGQHDESLGMSFCKKACTHMGASYYRWFHDGCCECSGRYCLNYGIDKPMCKTHNSLHQ